MVKPFIKIAFIGKMRSGKSIAANYANKTYGYEVLSFGKRMKDTANEIFDIGDSKPRGLYQKYAQAMRSIEPNVWVNQLDKTYRTLVGNKDVKGVVIDDLRQPNEYQWARDNGFTLVRIEVDESTRVERAISLGDEFKMEDLAHETELYIDTYDVDRVIENTGEVDDYIRDIQDFIEEEIWLNSGTDAPIPEWARVKLRQYMEDNDLGDRVYRYGR